MVLGILCCVTCEYGFLVFVLGISDLCVLRNLYSIKVSYVGSLSGTF